MTTKEQIEDLELEQEAELENQVIEDNLEEAKIKPAIRLDYTLKSPHDRNALVQQIINSTPVDQLTPKYLEILSDYIIFAMEKEERQQKKIITSNRLITINKHETSFEGLCGKLENGEDGIYNMLSDLGKQTFLTLKDPITKKDIEEIEHIQPLIDALKPIEEAYAKASGKKKFLLKQQIIEMHRDIYSIRNDARNRGGKKSGNGNGTAKLIAKFELYDDYSFDEDNNPINRGLISFFNKDHIEAILCNYSALKESGYGEFKFDLGYMMEDFDNLVDATLKDDYPLYYDLLIYKIDGKTNLEIQSLIEQKYNIKHSVEYLSSLWRNKIPKLIAEKAQEEYLTWYYTIKERGQWKRCTRCGEIKLAHNKFFSKNKSSKDGGYSLCKCCRNAGSAKNKKRIELKKQLDKNS